MSIFLPYVYIMRHCTTSHFYIGMRSANTSPAEQDLGHSYYTSNKIIQNNFSDYDATIIAYFRDWEPAFIFENELIKQHWGDPLLMNKHYQEGTSTFSMKGFRRPDVSHRNRITKRRPKELRSFACSACNQLIQKEEFCHHKPREHYFCNARCRNQHSAKQRRDQNPWNKGKKGAVPWNKGKTLNKETKQKISAALKGRLSPQAGKPLSDQQKERISETRRKLGHGKRAAKYLKPQFGDSNPMRDPAVVERYKQKITGRKRVLRDGKYTWAYPSDLDYPDK